MLAWSAGAACLPHARAGDLAWAIDRPAIPVRHPDKAVLLGAALCGDTVLVVGERGVIVLSMDLGRTWHQAAQVPTSTTLTAVQCQGASGALAVGHGAVVLATSDGGEHWSRQIDGRKVAQQRLAGAQARQPEDAKDLADAQRWVTEGPDKPLLDVVVGAGGSALAVGAYNLILESVDGGKNWRSIAERLDNPKQLHLHVVARHGDVVVIAGEQGLIFRSEDGGKHFMRLNSPYSGSWYALALLDDKTMILGGLRGQAWWTRDAGANWLPVKGLPPVSVVSARVIEKETVMLQNQIGQLFRTSLDGTLVVPLGPPNSAPSNGMLPLPGGNVLALTVQGIGRVSAQVDKKEHP